MLKRISVKHLQPGMYVANITQTGISLHQHEREGRVKDAATVSALIKRGIKHVYIDTEQGSDSQHAQPPSIIDSELEQKIEKIVETPTKQNSRTPLQEEFSRAQQLHKQALSLVGQAMAYAKTGKPVEVEPFQDMASSFIGSIFRNQDALACLCRIRDKDSYLMEHSVNVSVLMGILGKHLELEADYLNHCVTGALLHDIGKILIPDRVLHKPGKLSDEEFSTMKQHATFSQQILQQNEHFPQPCINIAGQHHERLDGKGYPLGLQGEEISQEGRMVAVVDVYDAITANRVYHKGMTPNSGFKRLLEWSGPHLDTQYVHAFIKAMGIYPIGSVVELSNRKLAIVQEETIDTMRPAVRIFYDLNINSHCPQAKIDLTKNTDLSIIGSVDPNSHGIDVIPLLNRPIFE